MLANVHGYFGTKHIILLAISIILIILLFIFSKKISLKQAIKVMMSIGIVSEIIKVTYFIVTNEDTAFGYLPKTDLPFHLCSIQILLIFIAYFTKNENVKNNILGFMLPTCLFGGIAALLLPTVSSRNGFLIITVQYFGYHLSIVTFALYLFRTNEIKWEIKNYFNTLKLLALIGFGAIYLNSIIYDENNKVNFMYVVRPPVDNLPYLNNEHGWLVYIIHYAILAVILITLCYIKPIIKAIKKEK